MSCLGSQESNNARQAKKMRYLEGRIVRDDVAPEETIQEQEEEIRRLTQGK